MKDELTFVRRGVGESGAVRQGKGGAARVRERPNAGVVRF